MNFFEIQHSDVCNGSGLRVVLWLSGCSHHCYNCQNPQTWNPNNGIIFDESSHQEVFDELSKNYISGITFTGGDPLFDLNINEILSLIKEIRKSFPTKTIWLYTGYNFESLKRKFNDYKYTPRSPSADKWITRWKIISLCDVLVDGKYVDELRDVTLKFRGSSNQRVIDVKETLKQNKIVLYCD